MQRGSPIDSELLTGSTNATDTDPSYLCLHHKTMQDNWHQYIQCTSMRVGMLKQHRLERDYERNSYLGSSQLLNT